MYNTDRFQDRLQEVFGGRLRIRWSTARHEFHIEERVGRAVVPPIRIQEGRDDLIRARDGYAYVMAVRPGDRMPCPHCGRTLRVPVFQSGIAVCGDCSAAQQRNVVFPAAYFPLGENLIDHLRSIDPLRDTTRDNVKAADTHNKQIEAAEQRDLKNFGEDITRDAITTSENFPMVGYTGKTFKE